MVRKKNPTENTNILAQIRFAESYTSLIIGVVVVITASVLITSVLKSINIIKGVTQKPEISSQKTENIQVSVKPQLQSTTYVVAEGDTLKTISIKFFNSEDNWEKIAKENNIANPDLLEIGATLKISGIPVPQQVAGEATVPVEESNKITGDTYTVKAEEHLWDIAVRAYGDGFKWVDIVKANNLGNPDVLEAGTILKIPR